MKKRVFRPAYWHKYKYSVTPEQYDAQVRKQGGKCFICGRVTKLVVDHVHHTMEFRGLLCRPCNGALGWFEAHKVAVKEYLGG